MSESEEPGVLVVVFVLGLLACAAVGAITIGEWVYEDAVPAVCKFAGYVPRPPEPGLWDTLSPITELGPIEYDDLICKGDDLCTVPHDESSFRDWDEQ